MDEPPEFQPRMFHMQSMDDSRLSKDMSIASLSSDHDGDDDEGDISRQSSPVHEDGSGSHHRSTGRVKGPWSKEEDELLASLVAELGAKKWSQIAERVPGRIGKQCRERWLNHLDNSVKKTPWTEEEDNILLETQKKIGNKWCEIARMLPGRPENAVKNRFNSLTHQGHGAPKLPKRLRMTDQESSRQLTPLAVNTSPVGIHCLSPKQSPESQAMKKVDVAVLAAKSASPVASLASPSPTASAPEASKRTGESILTAGLYWNFARVRNDAALKTKTANSLDDASIVPLKKADKIRQFLDFSA